MNQFQRKNVVLQVSQITKDGWWLGNTTEHVAKGTALGDDFTENLYTPSVEGMIGRYNRQADRWQEFENKALNEYWNQHGEGFIIAVPDGDYPDGAITEKPPEFNAETQTVLYKDGGWKVFPILIDTPYWDSEANALLVCDFNFTLPENHTFEAPPIAKQGHVVRLVDDQWQYQHDHRNKTIYNTLDCTMFEFVETLGPIKTGWTLTAPATEFDQWINNAWVTNLSVKYIADYDQVDSTRRGLYNQMCDPLVSEANIKRLQGNEAEAKELEEQALAAWQKIHDEHPWPDQPIN